MLPKLRHLRISEELFDDALRDKNIVGNSLDLFASKQVCVLDEVNCEQGEGVLPRQGGYEIGVADATRTVEGFIDACIEPHLLAMRLAAQEQRDLGVRLKAQKAIVGLVEANAGPKQQLEGVKQPRRLAAKNWSPHRCSQRQVD